jgi:hypothetical protein
MRTTITVEPDDAAWLQRLASDGGTSFSATVDGAPAARDFRQSAGLDWMNPLAA